LLIFYNNLKSFKINIASTAINNNKIKRNGIKKRKIN